MFWVCYCEFEWIREVTMNLCAFLFFCLRLKRETERLANAKKKKRCLQKLEKCKTNKKNTKIQKYKKKKLKTKTNNMLKYGWIVEHKLTSLLNLLEHAGEIVGVYHQCVWCYKRAKTLKGVRNHMTDLTHCKLKVNGPSDEFGMHYNWYYVLYFTFFTFFFVFFYVSCVFGCAYGRPLLFF